MMTRTLERLAAVLTAAGYTVHIGRPQPEGAARDLTLTPVSEMPLLRIPMGHVTSQGTFVECSLGPDCGHLEAVYEVREIRLYGQNDGDFDGKSGE